MSVKENILSDHGLIPLIHTSIQSMRNQGYVYVGSTSHKRKNGTSRYFVFRNGEKEVAVPSVIDNEQFLQNYKTSWFRMALSGKDFDPLIGREPGMGNLKDKETWELIFDTAIEDLKLGLLISGKFEKNSIDYWEKQKVLLNEFVKKEEF